MSEEIGIIEVLEFGILFFLGAMVWLGVVSLSVDRLEKWGHRISDRVLLFVVCLGCALVVCCAWNYADESSVVRKENNHLQQVTTQLEKETARYVPWLFNVEAKDVSWRKGYVVDVLENLGSDWLDDWYNSNFAKHFVLQATKIDAKAQRVELTCLETTPSKSLIF